MDTSVLVIGIIIISVVLIPILLISTIISLKEKKLKNAFKEQCHAHKLDIKQPEIVKRRVLGVDTATKTLLFVNKQVENQEPKVVKLTEVTTARVVRKSDKNNAGSQNQEETVYRVDLVLGRNQTPQEEVVINFFDANVDSPFDAYPMYDKAMEWQRNLSKFMKVPEKVTTHR